MNTEEKNSDMLLEKGAFFRKWGFRLFLVGVILLVITIIVVLSNQGSYSYGSFDFLTHNIVLMLLSICSLNIGLSLYFKGLHYIGLGQIAKNTDKE